VGSSSPAAEDAPPGNLGLPWQGGQVEAPATEADLCFYCLTGLCASWHPRHVRESPAHEYGYPAATAWKGTRACWDCARHGGTSLP
jgi:hypothetical protein